MDPSLQTIEDNKDCQVLLKMRFSAALGLEKNSEGIQSPVSVPFKNDRIGLGMELGQEKKEEINEIQHIDTNLDTAKESATNSSKMETECVHPFTLDDDCVTYKDGDMKEDQNTEKARHMDPDWDKTEDWDEYDTGNVDLGLTASDKLMQMAQENNDINSITQSNDNYKTLEEGENDEVESNRRLDAPDQYMNGARENKSDTHTQHQNDPECKGDFGAHENLQMKNKQTCLSVPDSVVELAQENLKDKSTACNGEKSFNIENQSMDKCVKMEMEHVQQDCAMNGSLDNQVDCYAIQNGGDDKRDIQNENMNPAAPGQLMALCDETNGENNKDQGQANDLNIENEPGNNGIEMETEQGQEFWDTDEESDDIFNDLPNSSYEEERHLNIDGSIIYL